MDSRGLLATLQHADSFFPSGAVSFRGVLKRCARMVWFGRRDVALFAAGQLRHRWATADRPVLAATYTASDDLEAVAAIDRLQDRWRCLWSCAWGRGEWAQLCSAFTAARNPERCFVSFTRAGAACAWSCRCGSGPSVARYRRSIRSRVGVSAHCFCIGMIGAALRLGIIGHLDGQRVLAKLHDLVVELQATPIPSLHEVSTFTPACDIAFMRHELQPGRLFAN